MNLDFDIWFLLEAIMKLGLTTGLCFFVALEREWHSHPGGVTTNVLVGLGSTLFTMISVNYNKRNGLINDPLRLASQVVSGMGFLGSATIYKSENYVKGINTAAGLWILTAIGMSVGADMWELGVVTMVFAVMVFLLNNKYKKYVYRHKKKTPIVSKVSNDLEDIFIDDSIHECSDNECEVCEPYNNSKD